MKLTELMSGEPDAVSEVYASLERVLSERKTVLTKAQKIRTRRADLLAPLGRGHDIFSHPDFKKAEALGADEAALDARVRELTDAEEALRAKLADVRDSPLQQKIDAALRGKLDEHRLAIADLDGPTKRLLERRAQIVEERAKIYAATKGRTEFIDLDERAAHRYAQELVKGLAEGVMPPAPTIAGPAEMSRDRVLLFEQRAVDNALKMLSDKRVLACASMAVAWNKEVDGVWREHAREVVLLRILLATQDRRSIRFIKQCPAEHFVDLPLAWMLDGREIDLVTLTEGALAQGIVTLADVQEAQSGRRS